MSGLLSFCLRHRPLILFVSLLWLVGGLASLRSALMPTLLCSAAGAGDVEALTAMLADGAVRHRPDLTSPAHAVELTGRWSRN